MLRSLLSVSVLMLSSAVSAQSPEKVGPAPIQMPDIRANIMQMLQEGKKSGGEVTGHDFPHQPEEPAPIVPEGEIDLFSEAAKQQKKPHDVEQPAAPSEPVPPSVPTVEQKPAKVEQKQEYVELPSKQITIEGIEDLKKLSREFEKARERQQGK